MKYILILITGLLFSCHKLEHSEEMYEEGEVTYMHYTPSRTDMCPTINSDGDLELDYETIPEKYEIGFSCEHGGFKLSNHRSKELFYNFRVGDEVIITYREIEKVIEKDGKEVERHFYDWDFVTAVKLNRNGPREK